MLANLVYHLATCPTLIISPKLSPQSNLSLLWSRWRKRMRVGLQLGYCPLLMHYHIGAQSLLKGPKCWWEEPVSGSHFLRWQTMYPLAVCVDWVILVSFHASYLSCSLSSSIWKHCCLEFYSLFRPRKTRSILLYFSINHFQGHSSTKMYNGGCFSWSPPTLLHRNAPFIEECLTAANTSRIYDGAASRVCGGRWLSPTRCPWPQAHRALAQAHCATTWFWKSTTGHFTSLGLKFFQG